MKIDDKGLVDDLKTAVVEILFEKVDGSQRLMKATLQSSYVSKPFPNEAERQRRADELAHGSKEPVPVMHVWDVVDQEWRAFRLNKVLSCQLTGG